MRTRQEIKSIGKSRFHANYWPCVLACLLVALAIGVVSGALSMPSTIATINNAMSGDSTVNVSSSLSSSASILVLIIAGPLTIGLCHFFVMNVLGRSDISCTTPFTVAFTNYGRKLGGYLWMYLFLFLWSLIMLAGVAVFALLVAVGAAFGSSISVVLILLGILIVIASCIPLIIKSFSYAMTTYILADCPDVKAQDALKLSMRIMDGHKWELFVFYLSFIGWYLLSLITLCLLSIFYVDPYFHSSMAVYYLEVREQALRTGVITMGQLEGTEPV